MPSDGPPATGMPPVPTPRHERGWPSESSTQDRRPLRGQVYRVDLGHGAKPWVVVSNNARNRNLETSLAVRITTTDKHANLPTVVPLSSADPLVGYVLVDDIIQLYRDELVTPLGALAPATMQMVSAALRIALP